MTYEIYGIIFVSAFFLCGVMLVLTVIQLICLKKPEAVFEIESEITYIHTAETLREEDRNGI